MQYTMSIFKLSHRSPLAIAVGIAPLFAAAALQAAVSYDGFDYLVGGTLAGNPDWALLNTGTAPVIASGNLTVPGLAAPTGNKVSYGTGNIQEAIGTTDAFSSGTVYFSLAFRLTSAPTATATYSYGLATGNTNYGATVWLQGDGVDGFEVGLANRSNSTPVYDVAKLALNTTHFFVASYTFVEGTANDASQLWINPSPATFGSAAAPAFTLSTTGGTDLAQITQFLLRGAAGSPSGEIDELRIGTSWAAVTVPEPGTFAAIAGGTAFLGLFRRRRR